MTADDATVLPCWALVDIGTGIRVAGWAEQTDIGGQPFIAIRPHQRETINANAAHVTSIIPCSEQVARDTARRQWAPSVSAEPGVR